LVVEVPGALTPQAYNGRLRQVVDITAAAVQQTQILVQVVDLVLFK
jgi:hypothetical protein